MGAYSSAYTVHSLVVYIWWRVPLFHANKPPIDSATTIFFFLQKFLKIIIYNNNNNNPKCVYTSAMARGNHLSM